MAKDQDLPLNPLRISGACGRLMCCLKYEHPLYQKFQESAPAVGTRVTTPDGDGRVAGHSVPRDAVTVRLDAVPLTPPSPHPAPHLFPTRPPPGLRTASTRPPPG
ncbi:hypothetical protein LQ51_03590 [Micromonospora sp. HK10]|nr:hypothetical protein LQ51_03590 [Micromonospora sp. HK10]